MAEYIEREAAVHLLMTRGRYLTKDLVMDAAYEVSKIPAADVAPVVRCKDCKWYGKNEYNWEDEDEMFCKYWTDWLPTYSDDFCSYGERKDGEG